MRCYLDNDALHKLAALDLLPQALAAIGASEFCVLHTARFRFMVAKNEEKGRAKFGAVVWARLRTAIMTAPTVSPGDVGNLDTLTDVLDIDQGEAVLFSAAAADPSCVLVTGDKRSLQALAAAPTCQAIVAQIRGRVLCLEQVIERLISGLGLPAVMAKVAGSTLADATLLAVFGEPKTAESVAEGLTSYIRDLRSNTGSILAE